LKQSSSGMDSVVRTLLRATKRVDHGCMDDAVVVKMMEVLDWNWTEFPLRLEHLRLGFHDLYYREKFILDVHRFCPGAGLDDDVLRDIYHQEYGVLDIRRLRVETNAFDDNQEFNEYGA
jgi:hypothetical protein